MKNKPWFRIDRISPCNEKGSYLRLAYSHTLVSFIVKMELEDKPYKLSEIRGNKMRLMQHFIEGVMNTIGVMKGMST